MVARSRFAQFPAAGENERGFRAQTPNGTASDRGDGWNHDYHYAESANGDRWTMPPYDCDRFGCMPGDGGSKKPAGRGANRKTNRTGE